MKDEIRLSCLRDTSNPSGLYSLEILFNGIKVRLIEGDTELAMDTYDEIASEWKAQPNFKIELNVKPYDCDRLVEGKICVLSTTPAMKDNTVKEEVDPSHTTYSAIYLGLSDAIIDGNSSKAKDLAQILSVVNQSPKITIEKNDLVQMQKNMNGE